MTPRRARRAAIYARLSVTTEESVSIARQVDAATKYAEARGWDVVLTATDDGVSATKNKPQDRPGWRSILDSPETFDVVIVWKVDRLARRVLDFLQADEALQKRGAALVAVEDPIDMTTAQGRAFATMLAVFGELEAAAISARVTAARAHLIREGRPVGARPWPYETVPNPDGAGVVWRPIPERADAIRDAIADLVARRTSLAAVARAWSDRFEPPTTWRHGCVDRKACGRSAEQCPKRVRASSWNPATVRRLLTSPVLTGATVIDDGRPEGKKDEPNYRPARPVELLRDASGVIVRDDARAILTPKEHRAIVALFDDNAAPVRAAGARPTRLPLLFDLARCAACGSRMVANRPTDPSRPHRYLCQNRECTSRSGVDLHRLEEWIVSEFQAHAADRPVVAWDVEPDRDDLDALTEALEATNAALVISEDDDETASLLARRKELRAAIRDAEDAAPSRRFVRGVSVGDMFDSAGDDVDAMRAVLASVIDRVEVRRTTARRGARVEDRASIVWRDDV